MHELTQLTKLCRGVGATEAQAAVMARQLIKRADQLTVERGQKREEVMAYLLRLVVQGHSGAVPPEFQPPATGTQRGSALTQRAEAGPLPNQRLEDKPLHPKP